MYTLVQHFVVSRERKDCLLLLSPGHERGTVALLSGNTGSIREGVQAHGIRGWGPAHVKVSTGLMMSCYTLTCSNFTDVLPRSRTCPSQPRRHRHLPVGGAMSRKSRRTHHLFVEFETSEVCARQTRRLLPPSRCDLMEDLEREWRPSSKSSEAFSIVFVSCKYNGVIYTLSPTIVYITSPWEGRGEGKATFISLKCERYSRSKKVISITIGTGILT
jgi:hypothetical protein